MSSLTNIGFKENTVFCVASERIRQMEAWNENTTSSKGIHNEVEFLNFISDYLREAITMISRGAEPQVSLDASTKLRAIAGMVIACSELNNWDEELFEDLQNLYIKPRNDIKKISVGETLGLLQSLVNKAHSLLPHVLLPLRESELFAQYGGSDPSIAHSNTIAKDQLRHILTLISSYALKSLDENVCTIRDDVEF